MAQTALAAEDTKSTVAKLVADMAALQRQLAAAPTTTQLLQKIKELQKQAADTELEMKELRRKEAARNYTSLCDQATQIQRDLERCVDQVTHNVLNTSVMRHEVGVLQHVMRETVAVLPHTAPTINTENQRSRAFVACVDSWAGRVFPPGHLGTLSAEAALEGLQQRHADILFKGDQRRALSSQAAATWAHPTHRPYRSAVAPAAQRPAAQQQQQVAAHPPPPALAPPAAAATAPPPVAGGSAPSDDVKPLELFDDDELMGKLNLGPTDDDMEPLKLFDEVNPAEPPPAGQGGAEQRTSWAYPGAIPGVCAA